MHKCPKTFLTRWYSGWEKGKWEERGELQLQTDIFQVFRFWK